MWSYVLGTWVLSAQHDLSLTAAPEQGFSSTQSMYQKQRTQALLGLNVEGLLPCLLTEGFGMEEHYCRMKNVSGLERGGAGRLRVCHP